MWFNNKTTADPMAEERQSTIQTTITYLRRGCGVGYISETHYAH